MRWQREKSTLVYIAVAVLVVAAVALLALTNFIEGKLEENGERQSMVQTEQMANFVGESVDMMEAAIGSFTIESTDPESLAVSLSAFREGFGFSQVAFVGLDGVGIDADGDEFRTAWLSESERTIAQGSEGYGYSETYVDEEGRYVRMAQRVLSIAGKPAGTLYVKIPLALFLSPYYAPVVDSETVGHEGEVCLFEGRTGEVLVSSLPGNGIAQPGESLYDFIERSLATQRESRSLASGALTGIEDVRRAVGEGESFLIVGYVDGVESYICLAPTGKGSWYACDVISVGSVRAEAMFVKGVFSIAFILGVVCIMLGIAAAVFLYRRRAREREMEMKRHLYGALSDTLDMAVMLYSPADGATTPIVAKDAEVLGIDWETLLRRPERALAMGLSEEGEKLLEAVRANDVHELSRGEFFFDGRASGAQRYVEYAVRPLSFEDKEQLLVILRDVTEERVLQLSMKSAMETAEAANRAKSSFLSRMSHEIRTPMNVIIGMLKIARKNAARPQKLMANLDQIEAASNHLLDLINEVLDISKIESGRVNFNEAPFCLMEVIESIGEVVEPQCREKGQTYVLSTKGPVDAVFLGDEVRVRQLLVNLLTNAVKYTDRGGHVRLEVSVLPSLAARYQRITFVVSDDGIGMAPEFLEHLFEPFAMEGRSSVEGTGLGMPIVKNIVNAMGGDIHVESVLGEGTTVTVVVNKKMLEEPEELEEPEAGAEGSAGPDAQAEDAAEAEPDAKSATEAGSEPDSVGARELRAGLEPADENAAEAADAADAANAVTSASAADGSASGPKRRSADLRGVRVLLAEDSELNAEIAAELLRDEGLLVDWAQDGVVACDMFAASEEGFYDVILMDVRMPNMDGHAATRAIRALERSDARSVSIVAMSANAFAEDVLASLKSGMNAHLSKPIDLRELLAVIAQELGR